MTTTNKPNVQDFINAIQGAAEAIRDSIEDIDELNGRLYELEVHYGNHEGDLENEHYDALDNAGILYSELPVWDTLESLAKRLDEVAMSLEEKERRNDAS